MKRSSIGVRYRIVSKGSGFKIQKRSWFLPVWRPYTECDHLYPHEPVFENVKEARRYMDGL